MPHQNFGELISSYEPKRSWKKGFIAPVIALIVGILMIITGLDWYYYGFTQFGPIAAQTWSQDWILWGILIGTISLAIMVWLLIRSRIRVSIYRNGLTINRIFHKAVAIPWDAITGIASAAIELKLMNFKIKTLYRVNIYRLEGKSILLDSHIGNIQELITLLKANVYPRLLPKLYTQIQAGQPIYFGAIKYLKDKLIIYTKNIALHEINKVSIFSGYLILDTNKLGENRNNDIRIPIEKVANLELFIQLIQQGSNPSL